MTADAPPAALHEIRTKVVGVTFESRQAVVARAKSGQELRLVRELTNRRDPHAILITTTAGAAVGHLSADLARRVAPWLDRGHHWSVRILNVTGGTREQPTRGINIVLTYAGLGRPTPTSTAARGRPWWQRLLGISG